MSVPAAFALGAITATIAWPLAFIIAFYLGRTICDGTRHLDRDVGALYSPASHGGDIADGGGR